jgi:nitrilase
MTNNEFKAAVVQASPIFLDRKVTVEKACGLISDAASKGAKLIVFPEAYIPAYPDWVWVIPSGKKKMLDELYAELLENAITIPDKWTEKLCQAAKKAKAYVIMGLSERNSEASNASLFNTLLYIDPDGKIMGKHRKLVPTGGERLVWSQGDGSTLGVFDTPIGKLGGLICWENYMPLARYTLYSWGIQIYTAPTWDNGEPWLSTLRHIAKEGSVYVLGSCIVMRKSDIPDKFEFKTLYAPTKEWINTGDSVIIDPNGKIIAGPVTMKEEIIYADINPSLMQGTKWILDTAGHYSRPDVFKLSVNTSPNKMITTIKNENDT